MLLTVSIISCKKDSVNDHADVKLIVDLQNHLGNPNNVVDIALDVLGAGGRSESGYYVQTYTAAGEQPWQMLIDNQAAQAQPKKYA